MDKEFTSSRGGSDHVDILQEARMTLVRPTDQAVEHLPDAFEGYVLIVGTDLKFLEYYRSTFLELGFTPMMRTSYESALACLRLFVFDFIVVAQSRLGFEGRFIVEDDWRHADHTCVLVISNKNDSSHRLDAMEVGPVDYLRDPVAVPEMVRAVTAHLRPDVIYQSAHR